MPNGGPSTKPLASLSLIFRTPSRHCPFRNRNGATVEIVDVRAGRFVQRLGAYSALYTVRYVDATEDSTETMWSAFLDELFVVPRV